MNEQRMTLQSVRVRNFKAIVDSRTIKRYDFRSEGANGYDPFGTKPDCGLQAGPQMLIQEENPCQSKHSIKPKSTS